MLKWVIVAVVLLPVAEFAAFALVATLIGTLGALMLMLATSLAGFVVMRQAGRAGIARLRAAMADTGMAEIQASGGGFLRIVAGLLLFLPGFLTDLVGIGLLIGPLRRGCARTFRRWAGRREGASDLSVIDLTPGEWTQVPDREIENRSREASPRKPRKP